MYDFPSRQRENDSVATSADPDVCMRLFSTMLVRMEDYG
jgi:hypothetical protein